MAKDTKVIREPLLHITKRATIPMWKTWAIRAGAIIAAFIVCAIVTILLTGENPLYVFQAMFRGAFGTANSAARKIWVLINDTCMLLAVALAITPAFKMRFWNIGANGQVLIGGLAAAACMIYLGGKLPSPIYYIVLLASCLVAGAVWAVIPAIFKAKWGTNETLFTLMMNYVAVQLVSFFITKWEKPKGSGTVGIINQASKDGWLPTLGSNSFLGRNYLLNIIVILAITVLIYVYLKYSKQGYEISVVGESENTARYIGINVQKVVIRTMAISGLICGLVGMLLIAGGNNHTINTDIVDNRGFTAIMVSWLAKFNPFSMIITSFLLVFLDKGAGQISTDFGLNPAFSEILTGIILFFIIGCEFLISYKINVRAKKEGKK